MSKELNVFDWRILIPNFSITEIYSPDLLNKNILHVHDREALMKLQAFRTYIHSLSLGAGLLVNFGPHRRRGIRSIEDQLDIMKLYSKAGKSTSHHVTGRAFDITMTKNHDTDWLANEAKEFGWTGIGKYPGRGFVHVDLRTNNNGQTTEWTYA